MVQLGSNNTTSHDTTCDHLHQNYCAMCIISPFGLYYGLLVDIITCNSTIIVTDVMVTMVSLCYTRNYMTIAMSIVIIAFTYNMSQQCQ